MHSIRDFILLCAISHTNKLYTEAYLGIYASNFKEPIIDLAAEILLFRMYICGQMFASWLKQSLQNVNHLWKTVVKTELL